MLGQSRIGYHAWRFAGWIERSTGSGSKIYWIHEWDDTVEMSIGRTLHAPADLLELAYDVGFQLGRGHYRTLAEPYRSELRRQLLAMQGRLRRRIEDTAPVLADAVVTAWRAFRARHAR